MMCSGSISVNIESLFFKSWSMVSRVLHTRILGCTPSSLSLITECWIALDFISHEVETVIIGTTWTIIQFSLPSSLRSCLIVSIKCNHSISQIVPQISTIVTSASPANVLILSLISFVMCGMTWTVLPR